MSGRQICPIKKAIHLSLLAAIDPTAASTRPAWLVCARALDPHSCWPAPRSVVHNLVASSPRRAAYGSVLPGAGAADNLDSKVTPFLLGRPRGFTAANPDWPAGGYQRPGKRRYLPVDFLLESPPHRRGPTSLAVADGERQPGHQLAAGSIGALLSCHQPGRCCLLVSSLLLLLWGALPQAWIG